MADFVKCIKFPKDCRVLCVLNCSRLCPVAGRCQRPSQTQKTFGEVGVLFFSFFLGLLSLYLYSCQSNYIFGFLNSVDNVIHSSAEKNLARIKLKVSLKVYSICDY